MPRTASLSRLLYDRKTSCFATSSFTRFTRGAGRPGGTPRGVGETGGYDHSRVPVAHPVLRLERLHAQVGRTELCEVPPDDIHTNRQRGEAGTTDRISG